MADLRPYPFAALVRRMFRELERNDSIFDLPRRNFFPGSADVDLSVRFHGKRAAGPLGPAAGPQSQMAQNIVLSWLGGSRIHELKTVQIRDDLRIGRPCIDAQTVGYNIEWSQELKLEESLREYVKGAMLVEMLKASGRVGVAEGFGDTLYDMSVGYDLEGIRSERVQAFVRGMLDAGDVVDRFRREIPDAFREFRGLDYPSRLSDTLTLSTFHGCPSDEIERIIRFLLRENGLHCIVKLNPTLLGPADARGLLNDTLGYEELAIPDTAFENDTRWDQMEEFVERLGATSASLGLGFGVKFSNTLIVKNHRDFFPASEREMYLSGQPLHVLAVHLVARFRERFGARFPISFAAGIDRTNFPDAVALGLVPVTVCTDLLRPGGYGRTKLYFHELLRRMKDVGAASVDEFILRAYGQEDAARGDGGDPVSAAALRNTSIYAKRVASDERYGRAANSKVPKKIGRRLKLFDCVTCDKCVPVCPNDANFTLSFARKEIDSRTLRRDGDGWSVTDGARLPVEERHQIGNFADFCNDCGNCDVFCPEDGGPYEMKPRFFGSERSWRSDGRDGFVVARTGGDRTVLGRFSGREFRARLPATGPARYEGRGFSVTFDPRDPAASADGAAEGEVDLTYFEIMRRLADAVCDDSETNWIGMLGEGTSPDQPAGDPVR